MPDTICYAAGNHASFTGSLYMVPVPEPCQIPLRQGCMVITPATVS